MAVAHPGEELATRRRLGDPVLKSSATPVDRFGIWLSSRQIRRQVPDFAGRRVADLGCGYRATFARTLLDRVDRLTLLDVRLDPELAAHPKVTAIEGAMPEALAGIADASQDVVLCNSVLEHLWDPLTALRENWADARMNTKEVAVVLDRRIVIADI